MNILILGCGFIGANLAIGFHESEYNTTVVDKNPVASYLRSYQRNLNSNIEDVFKKERPDVVYYLVDSMYNRGRDPLLYYLQSDVYNFVQVLTQCVKYNVKKIIYVSSLNVSHDDCTQCNSLNKFKLSPVDNRAINYFTNEMYLQHMKDQYGLDFVSLRVPTVYGYKAVDYWSGNRVHEIIDMGLSKRKISLSTHIDDGLHLVYIGDLISALIHSMRESISGIYNIFGKYHSYGEIVSAIGEFIDIKAKFIGDHVTTKQKDAYRLNKLEDHGWEPIVSLYTGVKVIIDQAQQKYNDFYFGRR